MRNTSLAVSITHIPRYLGLAFLSIALISLPLSPAYSANPQSADQAAERAKIKQEYNRMKSEAALFNAYMEQLARVDATDFGNEAAVRAQLERLDRFKPDDVGKGFVSSLIVAATRNQKFREGVKQKAEEPGAKEFFETLGKDPSLVKQIPGADAAEGDVVRFSDDVKAKIDTVKKKVGAKGRTQNGDIDISGTQLAALDGYLDHTVNIISAMLFIQEAEASVIATMFMILMIAVAIIIYVAWGVVIINVTWEIYTFIQRLGRYHSGYSDCYYNAGRQGAYWSREFYRLGCWAAFFQ